MTVSPVDEVQSEIRSTIWMIRKVVHAATPEQLAADSPLPNWSRAHVVAHIVGFSNGMARQFEYALRGALIEQYSGGMDGRNADIETLALNPPEELKAALDGALDRLSSAIAAMTDWTLPISYRQGDAAGGLDAAWRELTIHLVDLDLGIGPDVWSERFQAHLFTFLAPRLPIGMTLALDDGTQIGAGPDRIRVRGSHSDIAAWLAGREPAGRVEFGGSGEPELGPWPARRN